MGKDMYESDNLNIEDTGKLMTQNQSDVRKKKIILIVASVVAVALIAALGVKLVGDKKYNDQIAIAEKALQEGNYEQAETAYLNAVDMNKRKTKAREGLAYAYALQGKFDDAGKEYRDLYKQTKDEKFSIAADDTDKGYVPLSGDVVPVRFWREADPESIPYSMELIRFLTMANDDFVSEGRSYSYDDQDPSAGADLLQGIMECKYEFTYTIPAGTQKVADEWTILSEYTDWVDWTYEGKDPEGWRDDQHPDMVRFRAETVDWILTELFNVPEDTIKEWRKKGEEEHRFYLADDGYYYSFTWIDSDEGLAIDMLSLRTDGVNFCVEYNSGNYGEPPEDEIDAIVNRYNTDGFVDWPVDTYGGDYETCYAMVELKTIDGKPYWSMHYNGTDLPPELRDAGKGESEQKAGGTQVVTEMKGTMEDELIDFLSYLPYYSNRKVLGSDWDTADQLYYNCKEAADCGILFNIMWNMPCVNYDTYPVDSERMGLWETGETDPLGRAVFEDGSPMMCYRTSAEAVNWIAENIFNASPGQIDAELKEAEVKTQDSPPEMGGFYLHDGYYYLITGGLGWETSYDFDINEVEVDGDYFIITYTEYDKVMGGEYGTEELVFKAKMQYKIIDGRGYWSLYERELIG